MHLRLRLMRAPLSRGAAARPPRKVRARVPKGSLGRALREAVARAAGIACERLVVCEVSRHHVFRVFGDGSSLEWIRPSDDLVAFETARASVFNHDQPDATPNQGGSGGIGRARVEMACARDDDIAMDGADDDAGRQHRGGVPYVHLDFCTTANDGLSREVVDARAEREARSEAALRDNATRVTTLADFGEWLYTTHLCYAVTRQHEIGEFAEMKTDPALKSY